MLFIAFPCLWIARRIRFAVSIAHNAISLFHMALCIKNSIGAIRLPWVNACSARIDTGIPVVAGLSGCICKHRLPDCITRRFSSACFYSPCLPGGQSSRLISPATQTSEPRNAWRWLNKLQRKLIDYRALIHRRMSAGRDTTPNKQHGILLSTLQLLFSLFGNSACARFQQQTQNTFL